MKEKSAEHLTHCTSCAEVALLLTIHGKYVTGASTSATNTSGKTPLQYAHESGNPDVVSLLESSISDGEGMSGS